MLHIVWLVTTTVAKIFPLGPEKNIRQIQHCSSYKQDECKNISTIVSRNSNEYHQREDSNNYNKELFPYCIGKQNGLPSFPDGLVASQDAY